ncbi:MAG: hypothetical protein AKCLJLPJ_02355 [Fimbriimonadales bacterium]|nr:hypothetical protein [Fimbriimonadales bacterium]
MRAVYRELATRLTVVAASSLAVAAGAFTQEPNWSAVYDRLRGSVVTVEVEKDSGKYVGSGFLVIDSHHVVTCFHVIEGAKALKVKGGGGFESGVWKVAVDKRNDIAVLNLLSDKEGAKPIPIGDKVELRVGDSVALIGSPTGLLDESLSTGIVSALREREGTRLVQTTAAASHGSSGSPLLNAAGQVVGVLSYRLEGGESFPICISATHVRTLLDSAVYVDVGAVVGDQRSSPADDSAARKKKCSTAFAAIISAVEVVEAEVLIYLWSNEDSLTNAEMLKLYVGRFDKLVADQLLTEPFTDAERIAIFDAALRICKCLGDYFFAHWRLAVESQFGSTRAYDAAQAKADDEWQRLFEAERTLYEVGSKAAWFDIDSFYESLEPFFFSAAIRQFGGPLVPDPEFKGVCMIGYAGKSTKLRRGDVIVEVEGKPVSNWKEFFEAVRGSKRTVVVKTRGGKVVSLTKD